MSATVSTPERDIAQHTGNLAIRPFRVEVPEADLDDLRQRIAATRWPEQETVADSSQGVPLATMQELSRYWATDYDWRTCETKLNALPQFITEIDGLDFHFIHLKSPHENALPLIVNHGWPGSIIEQLKIIGPLTDPTAHGGSAEDAFDAAAVATALYRTTSTTSELTRDEILDNITLYWLTNTDVSASRLYWEYRGGFFNAKGVSIPVAVTVFPGEQYQAPRSWTERAYPNLIYFHEVDRGCHFAAWEQPNLFTEELRAAFRALR